MTRCSFIFPSCNQQFWICRLTYRRVSGHTPLGSARLYFFRTIKTGKKDNQTGWQILGMSVKRVVLPPYPAPESKLTPGRLRPETLRPIFSNGLPFSVLRSISNLYCYNRSQSIYFKHAKQKLCKLYAIYSFSVLHAISHYNYNNLLEVKCNLRLLLPFSVDEYCINKTKIVIKSRFILNIQARTLRVRGVSR